MLLVFACFRKPHL